MAQSSFVALLYRVYKKSRQFRNGSQPREAASSMKFSVDIWVLVMWNKQNYSEIQVFIKPRECVFSDTLKMA